MKHPRLFCFTPPPPTATPGRELQWIWPGYYGNQNTHLEEFAKGDDNSFTGCRSTTIILATAPMSVALPARVAADARLIHSKFPGIPSIIGNTSIVRGTLLTS